MGIGDEDTFAKIVPKAVHHSQDHDQRGHPDRDTADGDHRIEGGRAGRPPAPQISTSQAPL
jgi:hypothetical protein